MPLEIRPFQPNDEAPLRARFSGDTRPPWIRLPHPYTVESLLSPREGLTVFVAASSRMNVLGLIAIDESGDRPLLIGPLVSDEQLADLLAMALLTHGLQWAGSIGFPGVRAKLDVDEDRGIGLFIGQGFQVQGLQEFVLSATPKEGEPVQLPPGLTVGPCPDLVSSDYLRLVKEAGDGPGAKARMGWTRPEVFQHLQRTDTHMIAARHDDAFVGLIELAEKGDDEAELAFFGLVGAYRDDEIASAFVQHALHHASRQLQLKRVWLTVATDDADQHVSPFLRWGFKRERAMVVLEKALVGSGVSSEFKV